MNSSGDTIRYRVRFTGDVQGVGFRATAVQQARGLDVHGFVRNEPDGSVRLDADGDKQALKELVSRIRKAMGHHIEDVQVDEEASQHRSGGFQVAY